MLQFEKEEVGHEPDHELRYQLEIENNVMHEVLVVVRMLIVLLAYHV